MDKIYKKVDEITKEKRGAESRVIKKSQIFIKILGVFYQTVCVYFNEGI